VILEREFIPCRLGTEIKLSEVKMPLFQAEPENFLELLQIVRDGSEISLKSGEYKGPFTIERSITIRGTGVDTVIFAVDEPALVIQAPQVRLENLTIARTVGGDMGGVVLSATKDTSPICQCVRLIGVAQNVKWESGRWDIPAVFDFGEVDTNRLVERCWQVQLGTPCKIISDLPWLRVPDYYMYPGIYNLHLVLNSEDIPTGTILSGSIFLEAEGGKRVVHVTAVIKAQQKSNLEAIYSEITNNIFSEDVKDKLPSKPYIPSKQQLQVWNTFLEVEERIAKARQFCVCFLTHNYGSNIRRVTFEIDITSATLDGSTQTSLSGDDFWQRVKKARNEDIILFESSPESNRNKRDGEKLGTITEINCEQNKIRITLDSDLAERINRGRYQIPQKGFLYFEAAGDIHQINQKKKALENLRLGRSQNPNLSRFLFDATLAKHPSKISKLKSQDLLKRNANPDQIAAVEAVLSAPDMVLIQGPPGTGKTTVIAEICYQVAMRGGKTLIASQANLAVDNALSRLVHNPVIRALRKGKAEKVHEEGQAFLEDNVIGTWLQNTANDCENNLLKRQENVETFRQLLTPLLRFTAYLKHEEEFQYQQRGFENTKANLEATCQEQETIYQKTLVQKNEVECLIAGLDSLLNSAPNINWEHPEVINFLPRLKPYTEGNKVVESFMANVRIAINQATELGFTRPARGAFGLAVWLRQTVATAISKFRIASGDIQGAITVMLELVALVQNVKKKLDVLNQLQTDYQQSLTQQQTLNSKLKNLESRKCEIDFVITAVKEWKSTAHARLYQILSYCWERGELLTDNQVQLPAPVWMLARTFNLPLIPAHYKINRIDYLPNWVQLKNALSYEVEGSFINRRGKQHYFGEFLSQSLSQMPIALPLNLHPHWQAIAKQFMNYQSLSTTQRRDLVENTQQFLSQVQHQCSSSWEPQNINSTLNRITQDLVESILTNARKCVLPIKTKTEQQLQHLQQQLKKLHKDLTNQQQQISTAQHQLQIAQQEANLKLSLVIKLLQKLIQEQNLPQQIHNLAQQYLANQSFIWENPQKFSTAVEVWDTRISQIEPVISSLEPFLVLNNILHSLQEYCFQLQQKNQKAKLLIQESQSALVELNNQVQQQIPENLRKERIWWEQAWETIPAKYKPEVPSKGLFTLEFLHKVKTQFDAWLKELEEEQTYLNRYQNFVQDWIGKLRNPSAQDRSELKQIYIDNANVIGITCVQAARGDFSKEFPSFDVVIIDEVSKCTPPELLIPTLKGKKIVLVGDHRQLPPMLREETIEDIAEEIGTTKEELSFIKQALFKIQFESADASIKRMLTVQYRMHPQIMGAINQFYEHRLNCGIAEPDIKRAHNLAGKIIQENQHIIWVKTPIEQSFAEKKEGTSRYNVREVDIIEKLCEQIEAAWVPKIAVGEPQKEIGIITFYSAQLKLIKDRIETEKFPSLNIRTGTVDIFQGMEKPVIIVSTVCNNNRRDIGFAKEPERVNVAFSRAQELLIVVGCHDLFTQQPGKVGNMYQEVSKVVRRYGGFVDAASILG
jgi:RecA/RadA recombinase